MGLFLNEEDVLATNKKPSTLHKGFVSSVASFDGFWMKCGHFLVYAVVKLYAQ